jgi:hypothetical protein
MIDNTNDKIKMIKDEISKMPRHLQQEILLFTNQLYFNGVAAK